MSLHRWQFAPRFRRSIFGWRSQTPIKRIKEAISEIRKAARKESVLAAEGAVLFLEKISPALGNVDSSSGAIGSAVNNAIEDLVPIISKPDVSSKERQKWLNRLWKAIQEDEMPYIEYLPDFWGELCVTQELASLWADDFINIVNHIAIENGYFKGTTACFSVLLKAKRYSELLNLLDSENFKWWSYQHWRVKALIAMNKPNEALEFTENFKEINTPKSEIARTCEEILLSTGKPEEAFNRYALAANQKMTNLATFNSIVKKYPHKAPLDILNYLIKNSPGEEGKWFAAAKTAGFFDLAIQLVNKNPADPHTLIRAAKEFAISKPNFAIASGLASLHWIIYGYGYEISSADIFAAYSAIIKATNAVGISEAEIKAKINKLLSDTYPKSEFVKSILISY